MLDNEERAEAAQIQAGLARRLDAARRDQTITSRERQRRQAKAVLAARGDMSTLRQKSADRETAVQQKAYRALFGIRPDKSAEDRAYRDSLAARDLSATEACALYDQAVARRDDLAMTALAELAWQHSGDEMGGPAWHPILDAFRTEPRMEDAMVSLVELANPGRLDKLRDKMTTDIQQPSDLPGNLDWLAGDAEQDAGARVMGAPFGTGA
jgi:hypothetical protein